MVIAYPGRQTGSADISIANEFDSVEVLFRRALVCQCGRQLDFLVGYRYARFSEDLSIDTSTTYTSELGRVPVGTVIAATDLFDTANEFNGAELGFAAKTHCCRWSMELLAKLALGCTSSRVTVNGSTTITEPGTTQPAARLVTHPGGVLALPTNSGTFQQSNFAVIPELGVTLGYDLTCRLRATVGYSFIYWSRVARPGDQIDTNVNTSQLPAGAP